VLIDAGANADCRPEFLLQFARMGSVYHAILTGRPRPAVGLLNIGSEEGKGNELVRAAYELLKREPGIDFRGNVEGRDIASSAIDVIVTDGFTGNVALKTIEGTASFITALLAQALGKLDKESLMPVLPALAEVKQQLDYEETGGALLLGVKGVCVIAHGSSRARAIHNALRVAAEAAWGGLVGRIEARAGGS
jgi:glycerol-3-phosphate acyltransferase PlsX